MTPDRGTSREPGVRFPQIAGRGHLWMHQLESILTYEIGSVGAKPAASTQQSVNRRGTQQQRQLTWTPGKLLMVLLVLCLRGVTFLLCGNVCDVRSSPEVTDTAG